MTLHQKVSVAVDRVRTCWAIMMFVAVIVTAIYFPVWCLLLLIPFGIVSYIGSLAIVALVLSGTVTSEEISEAEKEQALRQVREKLATGEHEPEEVLQMMKDIGLTDVVVVSDTGPVIGHFKDKPIYEYVLVTSPGTTAPQKFAYHGPANIVNGMPEIPVLDGMLFAHVDTILYSKTQPVK